MTRIEWGRWGEEVAARHLEGRGYRIVARNFRIPQGELDLVAETGDVLAFVEVKLRKHDGFMAAREGVTPQKQEKLRLAAQAFLEAHPTAFQPRFDVVEVYAPLGDGLRPPRVVHWENAF